MTKAKVNDVWYEIAKQSADNIWLITEPGRAKMFLQSQVEDFDMCLHCPSGFHWNKKELKVGQIVFRRGVEWQVIETNPPAGRAVVQSLGRFSKTSTAKHETKKVKGESVKLLAEPKEFTISSKLTELIAITSYVPVRNK